MQWGEGKAKLDRVLDNNSGQVKTCLQVHIIVFATVVLRTTMMTVLRTIGPCSGIISGIVYSG